MPYSAEMTKIPAPPKDSQPRFIIQPIAAMTMRAPT